MSAGDTQFQADVAAGRKAGLPGHYAEVYAADLAEVREITNELALSAKQQALALDRQKELLTRMETDSAGAISKNQHAMLATELELLRAAIERGDKDVALTSLAGLQAMLGVDAKVPA